MFQSYNYKLSRNSINRISKLLNYINLKNLLIISLLTFQSNAYMQGNSKMLVDISNPVISKSTRTKLTFAEKNGILLIPVRFIRENLNTPSYIDMFWKTFSIDSMNFKIDSKEMHIYEDKIGGNAIERYLLPIAPQIIEGRLYVPMDSVLNALGYRVNALGGGKYSINLTKERSVLPADIVP